MGVCASKSKPKSSDVVNENSIEAGVRPSISTQKDGFSQSAFIVDNLGKIDECYQIEPKKLGQGSYGSVFKATQKATGTIRAIKSISKSQVKNLDRFKQEIAIMKMMDHPNVIKLFETFEDHRNIYLSMELCKGGELFDRIIDSGHFTEVQAATIMQQIVRAIYYMHNMQIMHRDLKPENFLFVQQDEPIEQSILKIIDFGLSCKFSEGSTHKTKAGTPYYVAPQVLAGKYDAACDIWSCGVIMYIMLCGYPPFYGENDADVLVKVRVGVFNFAPADWKHISDDAKDLIKKMLKMNPVERAKAKDALMHVWIQEKAPKASEAPLASNFVTHLRGFRSVNKLKKAALHVIAQQMDEQKINQLRKTFEQLDENGDGQLSLQEMKEGLSKSGLKDIPSDLQVILEEVDTDRNGWINYTEFLAVCMNQHEFTQEDYLWPAFRVFDRNGDGKISKKELEQVLMNPDIDSIAGIATDIDEILANADTNNDGEIDFEEFVAMMRTDKDKGPTDNTVGPTQIA